MLGGTTLEAPAGYIRDFVSRFRLDFFSYITDNAAGKNMLYRQGIIAAAVIERPFCNVQVQITLMDLCRSA